MIGTVSTSWTLQQLIYFIAPKIGYAIICGGIIGLERELKNKAAGIKTNILICVGSTLFTVMSVLMSTWLAETGHYGDPARLAAQIIPGIGFIGGGAVIQSRGTVLGLTTAATIWLVAALGVMVGLGHGPIGIGVAVIIVIILVLSSLFENRVLGRSLSFVSEIVMIDPEGKVRGEVNQLLANNELELEDFDLIERGNESLITLRYRGHRSANQKFILSLWAVSGIREVRQV